MGAKPRLMCTDARMPRGKEAQERPQGAPATQSDRRGEAGGRQKVGSLLIRTGARRVGRRDVVRVIIPLLGDLNFQMRIRNFVNSCVK